MKKTVMIALIGLIFTQLGCMAATRLTHTEQTDTCNKRDYDAFTENFVNEFDIQFQDEIQIADTTPRIALGDVISRMQDIRRQVDNADVPQCAEQAKALYLKYMQSCIDFRIEFMAKGDKAFDNPSNSAGWMEQFMTEYKRIEPK